MSELDPETIKRLEAAVADLDAGKSTPVKRRPRAKKTEAVEPVEVEETVQADPPKSAQGMRPVQFTDEPTEEVPVQPEPEPEPEDERPILQGSRLIRNNEYARNSQSVQAVQDVLASQGQWEVRVDPPGYWGPHTQAAAVKVTGEEDPVAAARSLGFTVI